MTEQHECEWMWNNDSMIPFVCKEPDCRRFLDRQQSVSRLNEYETLKRATEALSAEDAEYIVSVAIGINMPMRNKLLAYADILKDG